MITTGKLKYKIFLASVIFLLSYNNVSAQLYSHEWTETKTFECHRGQTLEINSKYGLIEIIIWNKNQVQFNINKQIEATDRKSAQNIAKKINVKFTQNSFYISANTDFEAKNSIFSDIAGISEQITGTNSRTKINYTVYVPNYLNININMKFGDVVIPDGIDGDLNIKISNSNLKAGNISGKLLLQADFCDKIKLKKLDEAVITSNYCTMTVQNIDRLNLKSKSTDININKTNILSINSKRDKITINSINFLYGNTYFSDIIAEDLKNEADIEIKYGDFSVSQINKTCSTINLKTKSADIKIVNKQKIPLDFTITAKNFYLDIPAKYKYKSKKLDSYWTKIQYNTPNKQNKCSIILESEGGSFTIIER